MSVLSEAYAAPGRLRGVFRCLLRAKGQQVTPEQLEAQLVVDPAVIHGGAIEAQSEKAGKGADHLNATVREAVRMQLFHEAEGRISLAPSLPPEARDREKGDPILRKTLATLIVSASHDANEDFAQALAWYLCQDLYAAPGTWPEVERSVASQVPTNQANLINDVRCGQFFHWACFLGFAWRDASDRVVPDPTAYLRSRLPELLPEGKGAAVPLKTFLKSLAGVCPVFENGVIRTAIEGQIEGFDREEGVLSTVTASALLRLRDTGAIKLSSPSDADLVVFPESDSRPTFSHISIGGDA